MPAARSPAAVARNRRRDRIAVRVLSATALLTGCAAGWAAWSVVSGWAELGEAVGEVLTDAVEAGAPAEFAAAAMLAAAPAPPPAAGTAGQAAALGPAVAAAWVARDAAALNELVDRAALLRGLADPEQVAVLDAAGDAANPFRPRPAVPGGGGAAVPMSPVPPGVRAAYWPLTWGLGNVFAAAEPPPTVAADGVAEIDGLPAAALRVTFAARGGIRPAPASARRVLLVPTPDGRVGAVYLVGGFTPVGPPANPRGEYFAAAYRRGLIRFAGAIELMLEAGRRDLEAPAGAGDDRRTPPPPRRN